MVTKTTVPANGSSAVQTMNEFDYIFKLDCRSNTCMYMKNNKAVVWIGWVRKVFVSVYFYKVCTK